MGSGCIDHVFLNSELFGGEWSASCSGRFTPGNKRKEGWVEPSADVDDLEDVKVLDPTGTRTPAPRPFNS
jgi:hypothetical protein